MNLTRRTLILILIIIAGSGTLVTLVFFLPPQSCSMANSGSVVHFTIIESSQGFNGSKAFYSANPANQAPWPVMSVHLNQRVCLHIENIDSADSHGFQLDNYIVSQIVVGPGAYQDVSFVATKLGSFTFRCLILCVPHIYMQYGRLIVTS